MALINIVTDSSVCLPAPKLVDRYPITIAPMTIRCGCNTVKDNPRIKPSDLIQFFDDCPVFPVAEAPSIEDFNAIYSRLSRENNQILSIHASGQIYPSFANAKKASQRYLGRCNIQVVDSKTTSFGLGLLVQAAAKAAIYHKTIDELVRIVRGMIPRTYSIFFLDDLSYLEHDYLISPSQAILGKMLGINAFLTIEDGQILPMEKVRSRAKSLDKLIEFVSEFVSVENIAILQNGARTDTERHQLTERLHSLHPNAPLSISTYGHSLATHIGPRSIGIVILEAEDDRL